MVCNRFLTLPDNIKIPAIGYGTWQATGNNLEKALEVALEAGYRHIDTAQAYENEEEVGKVLKRWFDSGRLKREEIFITTKLSPYDMHPDKVEDCINESLSKLQLDYVNLYLVEFPISMIGTDDEMYGDPDVDYVDIWNKMEEQYDAGKAKSIGVSNFSIKKLERLLENCRIKPANNQVEMHACFQQRELVDFCKKNGITVIAYSPLGSRAYQTMLAENSESEEKPRYLLDDSTVKEVAKRHSKTPAQILLRFLLQLGVGAIPKSETPARIKENLNVANFSLDERDLVKLRALDNPEGRIFDWKNFGRVPEHPDFEF